MSCRTMWKRSRERLTIRIVDERGKRNPWPIAISAFFTFFWAFLGGFMVGTGNYIFGGLSLAISVAEAVLTVYYIKGEYGEGK